MRLFEERDRSKITCKYCFGLDHNKRYCPNLKLHWVSNPDLHLKSQRDICLNKTWKEIYPMFKGVEASQFPSQPNWDDEQAKRHLFYNWDYAIERFKNKEASKEKRVVQCGFCGDFEHTRRNCDKMKDFVYVLNETNKAYRSAFYDKFIKGFGLGVGAIIGHSDWNGKQTVSVIYEFPTDNIMFTNLKQQWHILHTEANVGVVYEGSRINFNLTGNIRLNGTREDFEGKGPWGPMYGLYGKIASVIAPAPDVPSKEWFAGQSQCFGWLVKKRKDKFIMDHLGELIKNFYPHDDLAERLGGEIYDQYYIR